jgi:hypothetical protein
MTQTCELMVLKLIVLMLIAQHVTWKCVCAMLCLCGTYESGTAVTPCRSYEAAVNLLGHQVCAMLCSLYYYRQIFLQTQTLVMELEDAGPQGISSAHRSSIWQPHNDTLSPQVLIKPYCILFTAVMLACFNYIYIFNISYLMHQNVHLAEVTKSLFVFQCYAL